MILLLGGFSRVHYGIHAMTALGIVMMLIYGHLVLAPYRRMRKAVAAREWPSAGAAMNQIRKLVLVNLVLGVVVILVATLLGP